MTKKPRFLVLMLAALMVAATFGPVCDAADGGHEALPELQEASLSIITCTVYCPLDEEWRDYYGDVSWQTAAWLAVEAADNALIDQFGLNLQIVGYGIWDSNDAYGTNPHWLLSEATSEMGLGGGQIMIAFTRQAYGTYAAEVGGRYALVADSGPYTDNYTQKVVSNLYGCVLGKTCEGGHCVVANAQLYMGQWCPSCWEMIWTNRGSKMAKEA